MIDISWVIPFVFGLGVAYFAHTLTTVRTDKDRLKLVAIKFKVVFSIGVIPPRSEDLSGTSYMETLPIFRDAVSAAWIQLPSEYKTMLQEAWEEYQECPPEATNGVAIDFKEALDASSKYPPSHEAAEIYQERFEKLHNCLNELLEDKSAFRIIACKMIQKFCPMVKTVQK